MEYKYCYLDTIYTNDSNEIEYYNLTYCNKDYTKVKSVCLPESEIGSVFSQGLVLDFGIENGYLKCGDVKNYPASCLGQEVSFNLEEDTLYSFINIGAHNDYIVLDDSLIECDAYKGIAYSKFKNIKFSRSTMSVYVSIYDAASVGTKMYNKMIVVENDGNLEFQPFYFGVPVEKKESFNKHNACFEFVKEMVINNEEYLIYTCKDLAVYPYSYCMSGSVVNKACYESNKLHNIVKALNCLIKTINDSLGVNTDTSYLWVGGNKGYQSKYGIVFKSMSLAMTSADTQDLVLTAIREYKGKYGSFEEAKIALINSLYKREAKNAMMPILYALYSASDIANVVEIARQLLVGYTLSILEVDMFLYRIRIAAYVRGLRLVPVGEAVLSGSEIDTYTKVSTGLLYGESEVNNA